ncbi:MAG: RNA 2',3'-cyclic phosphodiesterase [Pseudomonadota bacterium]
MRLFAAISPPDDIRDELEALQSGLPEGPRVPWENFHVTLAFFGEVDAKRAEDLDAALSRIRFAPFEVTLTGVDAFGGAKPRHLYAAAEKSPPLMALNAAIETAARGAGAAVEARRYVPHITLARLGGRHADERLMRWMAGAAAFRRPPFPVDRFALFRSSLGNGPPHYEVAASYPATSQSAMTRVQGAESHQSSSCPPGSGRK